MVARGDAAVLSANGTKLMSEIIHVPFDEDYADFVMLKLQNAAH